MAAPEGCSGCVRVWQSEKKLSSCIVSVTHQLPCVPYIHCLASWLETQILTHTNSLR